MKVSMKTFMPVAAAALLTLGGCTNSVESRVEKYMKDRPQKELDMLLSGNDNTWKQKTKIQSRLDSTAYRDIFNRTQAARNSNLVEEFNKIAASYRADESDNTKDEIFGSIKTKLINDGITVKELNRVCQQRYDYPTTFQHKADDWAYRKFFKKIGILNDVVHECDKVSREIGL